MISKIYESNYKRLFRFRKGTKRPNKSQAYKEAIAMSRLEPSIKRIVYNTKKSYEQ